MRPPGEGLENVHFLEYIFVLDIHCQQLGKMCQLEGVCAPFRRGVGECAFSRIYICIGYALPTIGENVSVGGCHSAPGLNKMRSQLVA